MTRPSILAFFVMASFALAVTSFGVSSSKAEGKGASGGSFSKAEGKDASRGSPSQQAEAPKDAATLLSKMASLPGLQARFREEKKLALLRAPLISEGHLFYTPPGYLLRRVEKPSASSVLITPKELVVQDAGGTQRIDLRSKPSIKLFVESFTRVLAGDHAALQRVYHLRFTPAAAPDEPWTLELTPQGLPLTELIRSVHMSGQGYAVERVRVLEKGGDVSETQLFDVDPGRQFSPGEHRELFGQAPPAP